MKDIKYIIKDFFYCIFSAIGLLLASLLFLILCPYFVIDDNKMEIKHFFYKNIIKNEDKAKAIEERIALEKSWFDDYDEE